jgi:hypothetical protein
MAALTLDLAYFDAAGAGSVTIRTYQRTITTYRGWSGGYSFDGGSGGSCRSGMGECPDGTCAPLGSTCCGNGSHCDGSQICIEHGSQCLARDSERICPNGNYCDAGFMCMNDGRCLSMLSDRYCRNGRYCQEGFACQPDDTCRSEAAIAAEEYEKRLEAERQREEEARAEEERQRRAEEEAETERRRQQEAAERLRPHIASPSLLGVPPSAAPKSDVGASAKASVVQPHLSATLPSAPRLSGSAPTPGSASTSSGSTHLAAALPPPTRPPGGAKIAGRDMTSNGTVVPPAPSPTPPVQVTVPGMTIPPNNGAGAPSNNNIPTPCQDLTGPSGCQNTGGVKVTPPSLPPAPVVQAPPRTTPPNKPAIDLGDAARTVQELLGTIPDSNTSVPLELGIRGASPSPSSPGPISTPQPKVAARDPDGKPDNAGGPNLKDDTIDRDAGELTEDEAKVCQQAFKEFLSPDSASEKIRKAKEFIAAFRSFKKLKGWLREQFKDYVDDHVAEILKQAIEDDVGQNASHEIEDARRFNEKLRDCDRAALKTFDDGIDEFLKESGEADDS